METYMKLSITLSALLIAGSWPPRRNQQAPSFTASMSSIRRAASQGQGSCCARGRSHAR